MVGIANDSDQGHPAWTISLTSAASATSSGGTGGAHYAGNGTPTVGNTNLANGRGVASQYDVACYHQPG